MPPLERGGGGGGGGGGVSVRISFTLFSTNIFLQRRSLLIQVRTIVESFQHLDSASVGSLRAFLTNTNSLAHSTAPNNSNLGKLQGCNSCFRYNQITVKVAIWKMVTKIHICSISLFRSIPKSMKLNISHVTPRKTGVTTRNAKFM